MKDKDPHKGEYIEDGMLEVARIVGAADAMSFEELQEFPRVGEMKKRDQAILCMAACGFPQAHIAEVLKTTQSTICEKLSKLDPDRQFRLSAKAKKAFITQMAEGRAMSAISSITYDDLMALDADKRSNVAQKMMKISQDLNQTKHKEIGGGKMDMLLEQMAAEAEDADFEEVNNG